MKFKDTKYGDLSNIIYETSLIIENNISSLEGCPKQINNNFFCSNINLMSLKGRPIIIKKNFYCDNNNLINLIGSPKIIKEDFNCQNNKLISLDGSPEKIGGDFNCQNNKLKTLKGTTKEVNGVFNCSLNPYLKNIKEQIIKNEIKAKKYITDEGVFFFKDIKKDFLTYKKNMLIKKQIKENNNNYNYGIRL